MVNAAASSFASGLFPLAEALIAVPGTLKLDAAAGINASNDRGIWTNSGALVREGALVNVSGVAPAAIYGQFEPRVVATADDTVAFAGIVAGNGTANRSFHPNILEAAVADLGIAVQIILVGL